MERLCLIQPAAASTFFRENSPYSRPVCPDCPLTSSLRTGGRNVWNGTYYLSENRHSTISHRSYLNNEGVAPFRSAPKNAPTYLKVACRASIGSRDGTRDRRETRASPRATTSGAGIMTDSCRTTSASVALSGKNVADEALLNTFIDVMSQGKAKESLLCACQNGKFPIGRRHSLFPSYDSQ